MDLSAEDFELYIKFQKLTILKNDKTIVQLEHKLILFSKKSPLFQPLFRATGVVAQTLFQDDKSCMCRARELGEGTGGEDLPMRRV